MREFPVEVVKEQICSKSTLQDIQDILEMVVSKGLGKQAGCPQFKVSGKTGTAQISKGKGGYKSGGMHYLVSFCGYFPSEAPKYSCIVAIQKSGLPASGGGQCGPVFREIAQSVMAKGVFREPREGADSTSIFIPDVSNGNMQAAAQVLESLNVPFHTDFNTDDKKQFVWGTSQNNGNNVMLSSNKSPNNLVPDVSGMGARDAVYLLESRGLKVRINGVGLVKKQSIAPNTQIKKGQTIIIELRKS